MRRRTSHAAQRQAGHAAAERRGARGGSHRTDAAGCALVTARASARRAWLAARPPYSPMHASTVARGISGSSVANAKCTGSRAASIARCAPAHQGRPTPTLIRSARAHPEARTYRPAQRRSGGFGGVPVKLSRQASRSSDERLCAVPHTPNCSTKWA
eukprot:2875168-Prymnesium_polylepis.1